MTQREIKFRAWTGGRMIEWDEYQSDSLAPWKTISIDNFPLIHMQYTNFKDKDGKHEIYEGDILKIKEWYGCDEKIGKQYIKKCNRIEVIWNFDGWKAKLPTGDMWDNGCTNGDWSDNVPWNETEVIGNIYENPELLINK